MPFAENSVAALRDRPVFICGHPKSGTSLVRAVLDSHPQLVVYPEETAFFRRFLPQAKELDLEGKLLLAEQCLIHIFTWNQENPDPSQEGFPDRDYSTTSFEAVRQAMWQIADNYYQQPGDILSAAVLAFGEVSGQLNSTTIHWVEKSPYNEYFVDQIYTWWPAARCIHVVRDPRDNFVSYRRKHPYWTAEFFATNWNRSTSNGLQNRERFGADRYLVIRYEDLVQSPETNLRLLAEFLQIEWHDSLATPSRAGEQWLGNSMFTNQFQEVSAAAVGRWKTNLASQDAFVIELMTRPWLQSLLYEQPLTAKNLAQVNNNSFQVLGARWRVASWPVRRKLARLSSRTQSAGQ